MTTINRYSLDVASPDEVSTVLRYAAEQFYESQAELSSAWQDKQAGKDWAVIASILERAADRIDEKVRA